MLNFYFVIFKKFLPFFLAIFLSTYLLFASNSKKIIFTSDEKKFLKILKITPANFWLKANDFSTKMSNGEIVKLKDYQGRFVLLNFWATWCYPCLKEMPDLERAYQEMGKENLVVLAVAMGEDLNKINKYAKKNDVTFPLLTDSNMEISKLYGVKNIPVTFLIDSDGVILGRALGIRDWSSRELMLFIKSRLK